MSDGVPATVTDLVSLTRDGEDRVFERARPDRSAGPVFYRVALRGEFGDLPRWLNAPSLEKRPRPARKGRAGRSLESLDLPRFEVASERPAMADLYGLDGGLFLVSRRLADVLAGYGIQYFERRAAETVIASGAVSSDYELVLPTLVIDAVDIAHTSVTVSKQEPIVGSGRFVTTVRYGEGCSIRADAVSGVTHFVEEFRGHWLWRESLFKAAEQAGAIGLLGSPTTGGDPSLEIRI